MSHIATCTYDFATAGSAALAPREGAMLTLIEGGMRDGCVAEHVSAHREARVRPFAAKRSIPAAAVVLSILASILCGLVFGVIESDRFRADTEALDACAVSSVRVLGGDTLWSIAESCKPEDVSTDAVVQWLRIHNGLDSSRIDAGQDLVVPVSASL